MSKLLGTPYKRGQSDVIVAYDRGTTDIEEGLALVQSGATTYSKYTGASSGTVQAISAGTEFKGASAVRSGLEIYVQVDDTAVPTPGDAVYVLPSGKFTQDSSATGAVAINAVFVDGVVTADGIVNIGASKRENQKCAMINIFGGM